LEIANTEGPYPSSWLAAGVRSVVLVILRAPDTRGEEKLVYIEQVIGVQLPASSPTAQESDSPVSAGQLSSVQIVVDAETGAYVAARDFPVNG